MASLIFYAWGEKFFLLIMLVSIGMNYCFGLLVHRWKARHREKLVVSIAVIANLSLLGYFKYANFAIDNVNSLLSIFSVRPIELEIVHLPLGISFFTFQAMTYVIDIYRNEAAAQRSIVNVALYISLFPQLIAGPIVRFHDIADQIVNRQVNRDLFASGVKRFIIGLAKKMLIANQLGLVADQVFSLPGDSLNAGLSWLGIISYTLQIYFDFSGYSDMAIGLGRMFGFQFLENFNYPYISRSVREFWSRWHISLSTWFRDYLYIPLGGNRRTIGRVYLNLFTVFFLCGLWHGASWNFILWGMIHGIFLVIERVGFQRVLGRLWRPLTHLYVMFVTAIAWVFFRADSLYHAVSYLGAMFCVGRGDAKYNAAMYLSRETLITVVLGLLFSTPVYPALKEKTEAILRENSLLYKTAYSAHALLLGAVFFFSLLNVSADTYNPFIYFRF